MKVELKTTQLHLFLTHHWQPSQAGPRNLTFTAKSKLIQVALPLRLETTKLRLVHYTGMIWHHKKTYNLRLG